MSDKLLTSCLPRRMSYNLKQTAPYIITFLVAFGLSLLLWRVLLPGGQQRQHFPVPDVLRQGNRVVNVKKISKDLQSQLNYVHEQNSKLHRARNLAIDKMLEIQHEKEEVENRAQDHKERADQLELALQQSRGKFQDMKADMDKLRTQIARMQELQRIMEDEQEADDSVKKELAKENMDLKNKLDSLEEDNV